MRFTLCSVALLVLAAGSDAKPFKYRRECGAVPGTATASATVAAVPIDSSSIPSSVPIQKAAVLGLNGGSPQIKAPGGEFCTLRLVVVPIR